MRSLMRCQMVLIGLRSGLLAGHSRGVRTYTTLKFGPVLSKVMRMSNPFLMTKYRVSIPVESGALVAGEVFMRYIVCIPSAVCPSLVLI